MEENRLRISSLLNLDVLASIAITIGMLFDFGSSISEHFVGSDVIGVSRYAYFMLALALFSALVLFVYTATRRARAFIWLAVLYVIFACISTALCGLYTADKLPYKFVTLFYWVAVMILSYHSVLSLNSLKLHVAMVVLALPILAYIFLTMRYSGAAYSGELLLNPVYYVSYLMPIVLLLRSKVLKVSGLLMIFVLIVLSYKRMAILAFAMSLLVYFYCLSRSGPKANIWRNATMFLGAFIFIAMLAFAFRYLAGEFGLDWGARMSSAAETGGSGRLDLWRQILDALAANPSAWLLGNGYEATKLVLSTGAHNDFIEIFYDFGLIGLAVYLIFIVKIIRTFFEMKKVKYRHFGAFAVSLVWFVFGSMLSMLVVYPYWFLGIALFWGITIADFENAKNAGAFEQMDEWSESDISQNGTAELPYA
jgi:hypothetical protein